MGGGVHGESVDVVVYFDFWHVGAGWPLSTKGVEKQEYQYLMMVVDHLSSFIWVEEAATCTVKVVARTLLRWCSAIGVPRVWMSDTANISRIALFGWRRCPWGGGTVFRGQTRRGPMVQLR